VDKHAENVPIDLWHGVVPNIEVLVHGLDTAGGETKQGLFVEKGTMGGWCNNSKMTRDAAQRAGEGGERKQSMKTT